MKISFPAAILLLSIGVLSALLIENGFYLLGIFLHFRTVCCGALPVVCFFPPAWQLAEFLDRQKKHPAEVLFPYTFFLSLVLSSAAGFILLTLGIGYPLVFLCLGAILLFAYRHWWTSFFTAFWPSIYQSFSARISFYEKMLFAIALFLALAAALLPPLGYDAHEYHLAVAEQYLNHGHWIAFPMNVYAGFPMNVEMAYLWPLSLQSAAGCTIINFFYVISILFALVPLSRLWGIKDHTWLAPLFFISTGFVIRLILQANIDIGLSASSAFLLLAYERYRKEKNPLDAAMMSIALGYALGSKYIAILAVLIPFAALVLWDALQSRRFRIIFDMRWIITISLLLFAPWLIRNAWLYHNPFYPLLYGQFGGSPDFYNSLFKAAHSPAQVGLGAHLIAFIFSPLQKSMAEAYPGGFSCLWIIGLPMIFRCPKDHPAVRALVFCTVTYICWFCLTQHNERFLASILPVCSLIPVLVFPGTVLETNKKRLHLLFLLIVLLQLWFAASFIFTKNTIDYFMTPTFERDYMASQLPHFRAIEWINNQITEPGILKEKVQDVLFIAEAQTYGVKFTAIAPTVFNFHPLQSGFLPTSASHILYNRFELERLNKGYGPLGWPLGKTLQDWIDLNKNALLEPVFDAYPDKPGYVVVFRIKK